MKKKTKDIIFNFAGLDDLARFCANTAPAGNWIKYNSSDNTTRPEFFRTKDFADAAAVMRAGCPDIVKKFQADSAKFNTVSGTYSKPRPRAAIVGGCPIVPAAIIGMPKSMKRIEKEPAKTKVVNLYYNCTFDCSISADEITATGSAFIAAVKTLESKGHRANIYATIQVWTPGGRVSVYVKVKDSAEYFNLSKLSYTFSHPSFLRRHFFKVLESTPAEYVTGGHGVLLSNSEFSDSLPAGAVGIYAQNYVKNPADIITYLSKSVI